VNHPLSSINTNQPHIKLTPNSAITLHRESMIEYELTEVFDYIFVYYIGVLSAKLQLLDFNKINYGWDDCKQFYIVKPHDHLAYRYEVLSILGSGAFGRVYRCIDHKNNEEVAVKILRNKQKCHKQGVIEAKILSLLNKPNEESAKYIIKFKEYFTFRKHLCIVSEILSINLLELLKKSNYCVFILSGVFTSDCEVHC
jgi:dual specificity tyrosine-phosphorylation-regulated kinase 2/3/4